VSVAELIRQRKHDAENRDVYGRAREIARRLGVCQPKKHGAFWRFDDGQLSIVWDDYAPNLWVRWNGKLVFDVHLGDVTRYRPDVAGWLERIDELYEAKVKPLLEEVRRKEEERWLKELREDWGIKLEEG